MDYCYREATSASPETDFYRVCGTIMNSNGRKDVVNSIFLPDEQGQLCTLCDSFGGCGGGRRESQGRETSNLAVLSPKESLATQAHKHHGS